MPALTQSLLAHLPEIYLLYGLAFLLLAFSLLLQPRSEGMLAFSRDLGLLAAFGWLHAGREWLDRWILLGYLEAEGWAWLSTAVMLASFLPLFEFGRRQPRQKSGSATLAPTLFAAWVAGAALAAALLTAWAGRFSPGALELGGRLFLGLPGAILAGLRLGRRPATVTACPPAGVTSPLRVAGLSLIAYGLLGLPAGPAGLPGVPAFLTHEAFARATGLPVQLVRAGFVFLLVFFLTVSLRRVNAELHRRERAGREALAALNQRLEQRVIERTAGIESARQDLLVQIAERERVETALAAERERLLALLEGSSDLTAVLDENARFTFVNQASERILGWRPEELVGRWGLDLVHPDDLVPARAALQALAAKPEATQQLQLRAQHRDGSWRSLDIIGHNCFHVPSIRGLVTNGRDVTDRLRAEEALRHREADYQLLYEANPHPMWVYDLETLSFLAVNDSAVAQYGYSRAEFLAMTIKDIRPAEDVPHLLETVAASGAGLDRSGIWRHRHKDGSQIDVEITSHKLDFESRPAKLVLALDVTERRRVEEARRAAEEKFRTLVEQIPAVTYIAAANGTGATLYVSPQIESLLGFTAQEWMADRELWSRQLHAADRDRVLAWMAGSNAPGAPSQCEYRILSRSGAEIWCRDEIATVRDAAGRALFLQGVMFDITERKRAELTLENHLEELRDSERRQRELALLAQREQGRMAALLSAMSLGILFEDLRGDIEYFNPAFRTMWAIAEELNLVGQPVRRVLSHSTHSLARPDHASRYVLSVQDTREISDRYEIQLQDGRMLTQASYPVRDPEGRLLGRLWIYEDITHERQTAQQLLYLAERDALTGLYNRHRFQEHLDQMMQGARRGGGRFALLYFDLDEFKYVNDTFGHRAGDTVLVRTASEMATLLRGSDVLARLGGDEFAILAPLSSEPDSLKVTGALAARVVSAVASIPFRFRGSNLRLTTSGGVAVYPEHGETAEDLIAHADAAMYQAKSQGKNTWTVYDPRHDPSEAMVQRLTWSRRIEQALREDLFELHFQGIFEPRPGGALHHAEALVRMRDPLAPHRLVLPADFIASAEKSGQILEIDRWVLAQAIARLAADPRVPPIAVNISGRSFDQPDLPQWLRNTLLERGVAPERLYIELTETAAVSDLQDAQRFIEAVRATGCHICLDDFGAGFSSFAYLKYLDVDVLKIDGLFIRELHHNRDNQVFVRAMVEVARGLRKTTIAECVEDANTLTMVRELGVDLAQGYHLGRPSAEHKALFP